MKTRSLTLGQVRGPIHWRDLLTEQQRELLTQSVNRHIRSPERCSETDVLLFRLAREMDHITRIVTQSKTEAEAITDLYRLFSGMSTVID